MKQEARQELDKALNAFGSPFMAAVTNLLADPARCANALDDHTLYGGSSPNPTPEEAAKMCAMISTIASITEMVAFKFNVDWVACLILFMFEAGRGYEREQTSISELERMFK